MDLEGLGMDNSGQINCESVFGITIKGKYNVIRFVRINLTTTVYGKPIKIS